MNAANDFLFGIGFGWAAFSVHFFTLKTRNGYTPGSTNQKNLASFGEEKH